ncbi:MAG: tRNA (guanine-N1)-methyltransferase [Flavobacteriaceae bacterium]|nr:tRNA (guanine-N1)-methyltransferase [Flavobacteriaceae bacterium]
MKGLSRLLLLTGLLAFQISFGQDSEPELSLDQGTIDSQFEFIFKNAGNYRSDGKRYEVVRANNLDKLRNNVKDSMNASRTKAAQLKATISGHESTITSLNQKLEETTENLAAVTEEKDSMSFIGIQVSKGTYNFILWTIILVLLLMLLLFIYRFRRSNYLTQEAKANLSELETEYEDHRRRALEREQRISRQLQDEINKYKKSK